VNGEDFFLGVRRHLSPRYVVRRYRHYARPFLASILMPLSVLLWKFIAGRVLPPHDYGVLMFSFGLCMLASMGFSLGIPKYVVREAAQGRKKILGKALAAIILLETLATAVVLTVAALSSNGVIVTASILAASIIPWAAWRTVSNYLLGSHRFKEASRYMLFSNALLLAGIPAIIVAPSPITAATVWALSRIIPALTPSVLRALKSLDPHGIPKILKNTVYFAVMSLSAGVFTNVDTVMLGALSGYALVGMYRAACTISRTGLIMAFAIAYIYLSVASAARREKERLIRATLKALGAVFILSLPLLLITVLFPAPVLSILFGKAYVGAATVLVFLAIIKFIHALGAIIQNGCVALGREKDVSIALLAGILANVAFNALLIPPYGMMGAALATAIAYAVTDTWVLLVFIRQLKHNPSG